MKKNNTNNQHLSSNELKPRTWLLYVLIVVQIILVIVLATKFIGDREEKKQEEKNSIFDFFNIFNFDSDTDSDFDVDSGFDIIKDKVDQSKIDNFNWTFEMYSGTTSGFFVHNLIDDVITNNKKNSDHIIRVNFDSVSSTDTNEIKDLKKNIDYKPNVYFEVSLDYDEDGYVYQITIER